MDAIVEADVPMRAQGHVNPAVTVPVADTALGLARDHAPILVEATVLMLALDLVLDIAVDTATKTTKCYVVKI